MSNHDPKCRGTVTRGANSARETNLGVSIFWSVRREAPAKESNEKYSGMFFHGDWSTELTWPSGRLRSVTLVAGMSSGVSVGRVRKLLSLTPAMLKLKPR